MFLNSLRKLIDEQVITVVLRDGKEIEYDKQEYKNDNLLAWLDIEKIEVVDNMMYLIVERNE